MIPRQGGSFLEGQCRRLSRFARLAQIHDRNRILRCTCYVSLKFRKKDGSKRILKLTGISHRTPVHTIEAYHSPVCPELLTRT
jgi:hypothetical protein